MSLWETFNSGTIEPAASSSYITGNRSGWHQKAGLHWPKVTLGINTLECSNFSYFSLAKTRKTAPIAFESLYLPAFIVTRCGGLLLNTRRSGQSPPLTFKMPGIGSSDALTISNGTLVIRP
jgi:hypothetical protein